MIGLKILTLCWDVEKESEQLPKFNTSEECARKLEDEDPLGPVRRRFHVPEGAIYVDGNSLGLLSKNAERSVQRVLKEWGTLGVRGWLEAKRPWFTFAEELGAKCSKIVGARSDEVVLTGTTTVNIHQLIHTFYKPYKTGPR
jgi:kynureninase